MDKRKKIKETLYEDLQGRITYMSIDSAVEVLQQIKKGLVSQGYVEFNIETNYGWDGETNLEIKAFRWETDEEFSKRKKFNETQRRMRKKEKEKQLAEKEDHDKKEYLRLKTKFKGTENE